MTPAHRRPWQAMRHWLQRSVRHKLLAMALGPLVVVFPLLVLALSLWGSATYDRLLITKVRSDLAVARGYFDQVLGSVGAGTRAVAESHRLHLLLDQTPVPGAVEALLHAERERLGLDFLRWQPFNEESPDPTHQLPASVLAALRTDATPGQAQLKVLQPADLHQLAPELMHRLAIPLLPTPNAAQSDRERENRAMVAVTVRLVHDGQDRPAGLLAGGVLLNQNLDFVDHINHIVYPEGSLPFGSQGTATLFLDDVRITTNVRLFQDQRAIGTRVSQAVRQAVLDEGRTWLDRAFVVNDWYVSAYEPLLDADAQRIGMLYVGFLEQPFRWVRLALLGLMALIFLATMALAAWLSLRWARSIFRPVERMNRTMQRVQDGDGTARVGPLAAQDELGALAGHLDELLDRIAEKTDALQRWGQELDLRVAERTAELAASNASLQHAQQQLVKSEKLAVIGQLAASVAHEINNPIAVMQGNLDLMRETLGPAAAPVLAEMRLLDEQIERMRLIVQQLLQHARPEEYAGYVEPLDVNDTVRACLVLVNHRLSQTRIAVVQRLEARHRVACNRQELQQVVINLLINAIGAMPQGGTLTLATFDTPEGACIEVHDSGPGLSPEVQQRLFQPFFTTRHDGNGLGLWISLGLVERYGGDIRAANHIDGPGAVFTICLPESTNQ